MMPLMDLFPRFEQPERSRYEFEPAFKFEPEPEYSVTLSTPSSRYEHEFKPIRNFKLTDHQQMEAMEHHVTHVCIFAGNEPKWLIKAAEKQGFKAVCLGYTRHKRHGFVTREVWGLAKEQK